MVFNAVWEFYLIQSEKCVSLWWEMQISESSQWGDGVHDPYMTHLWHTLPMSRKSEGQRPPHQPVKSLLFFFLLELSLPKLVNAFSLSPDYTSLMKGSPESCCSMSCYCFLNNGLRFWVWRHCVHSSKPVLLHIHNEIDKKPIKNSLFLSWKWFKISAVPWELLEVGDIKWSLGYKWIQGLGSKKHLHISIFCTIQWKRQLFLCHSK